MSPSKCLALCLPLFLAALLFAGCVNHIKPYKPVKRDYRPDLEVLPQAEHRADGSIWSARANSNWLFADPRANRVNDIVIVRIEETSSADSTANTTLKKDSNVAAQIQNMMGAIESFAKSHPNFDKSSMISGAFKSGFEGGGETKRAGSLLATVPAQIRKELPDGNLFIEGQRVILVNNEEAHFYVSGIIRPHDIDKDNSISSSLIADAQVEFTGRGVITEKNNPGWGSRALDYVWPF